MAVNLSSMRRATLLVPALAAGLAAGLVAAAVQAGSVVTPAAAAPATASSAPSLRWRSCDHDFRCSTLRVPISYADPRRGTIGIAVVEAPATGKPEDDVVTNPGGPGVGGVSWLEQSISTFPASFRQHVSIISFDPRGTGGSAPVRCLSTAQLKSWLGYDPSPRSSAQIRADVAQSKAFVAACTAHTSKLLLANVGTAESAADMNQLRIALGQRRLDYLGFSYGTYLGELYAEHYASSVGRFVLDGVVDPALSTRELALQQALGFELELHAFFSWCNSNSSCERDLPRGASASWQRLVTALSKGATLRATLRASDGGSTTLDLGMAETGAAEALYSPLLWPALGYGIALALQGDGSELALLAYLYAEMSPGGSFPNVTDANMAINCVDGPSPHQVSAYESLASYLARKAPDFGPEEAWGGLPCAYWPVAPTGKQAPVHAPGTPPVLIVGSTGDPATPYGWAQAVAKQFPHGVLLTRSGNGHTGYAASACVRGYVDSFFTSGSLPRTGTVCASGS